jgi:O-antigen/teichoic acid export membrane protein
MGEKITPNIFVFLKNLKYTIFSYGIAALCVFSFEILAGRKLGTENYGKYVLSTIISLFLSLLTTMGITIATIKYIAQEKNQLTQKKIITAAYSIVFFLILVMGAVICFLSPLVLRLFSVPLDIFYTAVFFTTCFSLYSLATDILRGLSEIKKLSLFRVAYGLLIISFLIIFLFFGNISFKTAIFIIGFSYIFIFFLTTISIRKYFSFSVEWRWIKELLRYGVYAMVGGSLLTFLPRLGQIFVNKYLTISDVGIYNAYYLSSVSIMIFFYTTFIVVFFPAASKYKEKGPILDKIKKIIPFLFFYGVPFLFLTQWIILKLYGSDYPINYSLMFLFALSGILIFIYGLYGWLFYSKDIWGAKIIASSTIFVLVINIFFNTYLIPRASLHGAALAIIFAYLIGIFFLYLFQKKLIEQ